MTIISRDGPDKLIVENRAQSVTFNWTQVTFAVNILSSQKLSSFGKTQRSAELILSWQWDFHLSCLTYIKVFQCPVS